MILSPVVLSSRWLLTRKQHAFLMSTDLLENSSKEHAHLASSEQTNIVFEFPRQCCFRLEGSGPEDAADPLYLQMLDILDREGMVLLQTSWDNEIDAQMIAMVSKLGILNPHNGG